MMLNEELRKRNLPDILTSENGGKVDSPQKWEARRCELIDILKREIYGNSPDDILSVTTEIISFDNNAYAGKAEYTALRLRVTTKSGADFSFPLHKFVPKSKAKIPVFVHIAFRPDIPDQYMPVEEILDNGFALFSFCYNDVTEDIDDNFKSGIATLYKRDTYGWGKISMWAWAASRVMDYIETLLWVDFDKVAVIGHSRLGKTALWCAAQDIRFNYVVSNNAGCSGDAITKGKKGEHIKEITKNFPYWFCNEYLKYADSEENMPFDQHFLLATIVPRKICIGAAIDDEWADPISQYLSCYAASTAYQLLGIDGLVVDDKFPVLGDIFDKGSIHYHLREGTHFLSRYDWNCYMKFIKGDI